MATENNPKFWTLFTQTFTNFRKPSLWDDLMSKAFKKIQFIHQYKKIIQCILFNESTIT